MPVQKTPTSSLISLTGIVLLALLINGAIGYLRLRYVDFKYTELMQRVDQLAQRFKDLAHAQRLATTEQSQKTIDTVSRVMMVGTALAVAVLMLMLGMVSRRNRGQ